MTAPFNLENSLIITPALQGPPGVPGPAGDWTSVAFAQSPYQLVTTSAWVLVSVPAASTGQIVLNFPTSVNSVNGVFTIVDQFNGSSANPIKLVCPAGVTAWNPSNPGVYAASVWIADPTGSPTRFKFSALLQTWFPW